MLQVFVVASLLGTGLGQGTCGNTPDSSCVGASTEDSVSMLQRSAQVRSLHAPTDAVLPVLQMKTNHTELGSSSNAGLQDARSHERGCFNASAWFAKWQASPEKEKIQKYSQGGQDAVLASLFDDAHLGTTNKFYVEFGYNLVGGNTKRLEKDFGWTNGLRMDGAAHPQLGDSNLFQQWITPETITSIFQNHTVPSSPDYVSIDIDSCDLWVFLNMTTAYTPRVLTVEYNSNYAFEESRTNICKNSTGGSYSWHNDRAYGASFAALSMAANMRKYSPVWVETKLDVFLVRNDLICPGTEVNLEKFRQLVPYTFDDYTEDLQKKAEWTMPFTADMVHT